MHCLSLNDFHHILLQLVSTKMLQNTTAIMNVDRKYWKKGMLEQLDTEKKENTGKRNAGEMRYRKKRKYWNKEMLEKLDTNKMKYWKKKILEKRNKTQQEAQASHRWDQYHFHSLFIYQKCQYVMTMQKLMAPRSPEKKG